MKAPQSVRRILFIRTDRLGETLLNLPAIAALKDAWPSASITWLVHPELQSLLADCPVVAHVLADSPQSIRWWWLRAWRLGRTIRPYRFDLAIVSNPRKELHLAVWLARIPRRVGYNRKWGWLLTDRIPDRKALGERHEVEYNLDLVRTLGLPTPALQWPLPQFSSEQAEVFQLLEEAGLPRTEPFIAIHPWTSNPRKAWPQERYRLLLQRIATALKRGLVIIGGEEERQRVHPVIPEGVAAVNCVGRLTLRQLAALLRATQLLISNDSGPVHLAAAMGTPTVVLFGTPNPATGPGRWGPWGVAHTVIWKPSMDAISVDEVFDAVRDTLARCG